MYSQHHTFVCIYPRLVSVLQPPGAGARCQVCRRGGEGGHIRQHFAELSKQQKMPPLCPRPVTYTPTHPHHIRIKSWRIPYLKSAPHYKICGMISSRSESEQTIRHGHQLICLMKIDWFWCSELKIRSFQQSAVWTWECATVRTFFSSQNTKINQLSSGISAGAHV